MDELDPQGLMAQLLRRKQQGQAFQGANTNAHQYDQLAAIMQMANNPGAAAAAKMSATNAQNQYKPLSLGQQGFALPASGEFVSSPMYEDEKEAGRLLRKTLAAQTEESRRQETQRKSDEAIAKDARERELRGAETEVKRQGMENRFVLGQTMAEIARARAEAAGQKKSDAASKDMEKNLTKYATTLDKTGLPEVLNAIEPVRALLTSTATGKLSGVGRAQGLIPDFMATDEMQGNRTLMQDAANIILKARSGAAVTNSEDQRFLRAVGGGKGMDEKTLRTGWNNVLSSIASRASSLAAGYGGDIHDEFVTRGGRDLRNLNFDVLPGATVPKMPTKATTPDLKLPPGFKLIGPAP